jgi:KAP family P-loop domain
MGLVLVAAAIVLAVLAPGSLGRVLGTVTGLAALLATGIQAVRSSLTELKKQAKPVIEKVQQYAENRRRLLETALEVTTAQVDALQAELHELTPTGQLAALVERRGRPDSPYRAQLGLMTHIREDFEQMARLLADPPGQPPAQPDLDAAGDELPRIDRIVVYIDDLDRCPPGRVVQVLEAVQLLLAVPLFVVVVTVDPRWLLRSLTVHYRELFEAASPAFTNHEGSWGSTPMQYLEKIFQIPFTLPPVDHGGFTTLVDALTAPAPRPDRTASGLDEDRPGSTAPAAPAGADTAPAVPAPSQARPQPLPAAPVVERFDPLALTDDERRLIALLGPPLVTTPRSIKRLVNSYGLLNALRGSQHEQDLKETSHAGTGSTYYPYRAGIALLGTLIAFPGLSPTLFPRLLEASFQPGSGSWPQFLKRMSPEHTGDGWSSELLGPLATEAEALRWRKLVSALEKLTAEAAAAGLLLPEPLEAWAKWVVPVGRLSFETGRAVVTLSPPSAHSG